MQFGRIRQAQSANLLPTLPKLRRHKSVIGHPEFKTRAQRKGRVLRVAPSGISIWQIRAPRMKRCGWNSWAHSTVDTFHPATIIRPWNPARDLYAKFG